MGRSTITLLKIEQAAKETSVSYYLTSRMVGPLLELTIHFPDVAAVGPNLANPVVGVGGDLALTGAVPAVATSTPMAIGYANSFYQGGMNHFLGQIGPANEYNHFLDYSFKLYVVPTSPNVTYDLHNVSLGDTSGDTLNEPELSGIVNIAALPAAPYRMTGDGTETIFRGSSGNDVVMSPGFGDHLELGDGIDTLVFDKPSTAYKLAAIHHALSNTDTLELDNAVTLPKPSDFYGASQPGLDLTSAERLQFTDKSLALDLSGHAGDVARIIGAVFGASTLSNQAYVGIGLDLLDRGVSTSDAAQLALNVRLGANATHGQIVDLLYTNVVGSPPSAGDHAYYTSLLDSGQATTSELALLAAGTSLTAQDIDLVGLATRGLEYQHV
jgi:serralysin